MKTDNRSAVSTHASGHYALQGALARVGVRRGLELWRSVAWAGRCARVGPILQRRAGGGGREPPTAVLATWNGRASAQPPVQVRTGHLAVEGPRDILPLQ